MFDVSTLREPFRLEGKKTMGYELAVARAWSLPQAIVYPTGGGTGLIGMWKAFDEMEQLGWIGPERPKMIVVQADGCAPIVKAFAEGRDVADRWENASTYASGLRVPKPFADFLILAFVRQSGGDAIAVSDDDMRLAEGEIGRADGLFFCPEGAATWAAAKRSTGRPVSFSSFSTYCRAAAGISVMERAASIDALHSATVSSSGFAVAMSSIGNSRVRPDVVS